MDLRTRKPVPNPYQITLSPNAQNATNRVSGYGGTESPVIDKNKFEKILYDTVWNIRERKVLIEVCVCDTPWKGEPSEGTRPRYEAILLSIDDYFKNSDCLYEKLTEMLPLQQWGKVTADVEQQFASRKSAKETFEIFPAHSGHEAINKIDEEKVARQNCREFLHHTILQVPDTNEQLKSRLIKELGEATSRDTRAFLDKKIWSITLWRTIKLGN